MASIRNSVMSNLDQPASKLFTLIFVKDKKENRILLGMKKRGFGVGKWNGFGGKVKRMETVAEGAVRELYEECGLLVSINKLNCLGFVVYGESNPARKVYIFTTEYNGLEITESDEMSPKWFRFDEIPYDQMWADAIHWTDKVLTDTKFWTFFDCFDEDEDDNLLL